jgi:hypothetical protein
MKLASIFLIVGIVNSLNQVNPGMKNVGKMGQIRDSNYGSIMGSASQFKSRKEKKPNMDKPEVDKPEVEKPKVDKPKDDNIDDIYYFFSTHDYNEDGHLDGHELALSIIGYEFNKGEETLTELSLPEMEVLINHTLEEDDKDNDGKISWAEYLESQKYHHLLK